MAILSDPRFWEILEDSGSIDETRGMRRYNISTLNGSLTTFSKTHSYGEYIFDWAWAKAYSDNGLNYYPKLTSMVPFTPATARHFHGDDSSWPELLRQHDELLPLHSSAHFLFTTPEEQKFLGENNYLLRDSFQYHFMNEGYQDFEDFLSRLKTKKAKTISRERDHMGLKIEKLTGKDLSPDHAREMHEFYLLTIQDKRAIPYLTQEFFLLLFQRLPENVLYVRALQEEKTLAGALFFYDEERIYGRYWGSKMSVPNLHFELCYYQGIDFCIERKLEVFEAGAQGEHKISRGFRPVLTRSAHKINHPAFSDAIERYINEERIEVKQTMSELSKLLPFRNTISKF